MAEGNSDYDHRAMKLQRNLRHCEGKRLELERELFQHSSSDAHICHLKYMKLKNSLKEVCERGKKAHLRNQAFLQEFDLIEARLFGLISNANALQKKKMQLKSHPPEMNKGPNMSRSTYHPATIFMGRQMSASSSIEHCLTQRKSPQPTKSFSISDPHSVRQAAMNRNVTDSCVVPANSDIQCLNKPDKIDGNTSFQLSQKMPVTSVASSEDGRTHRAQIDKSQSGRKHLVESKQSAQLSTQILERLSPENRARDLQNDSPGNMVEKSLMYERLVPNEESFTHANPSGASPDACDYINNQTSDKHSARENLSETIESHLIPEEEDKQCLDSSSDLTVSISESEDDSYPPCEVNRIEVNQNDEKNLYTALPKQETVILKNYEQSSVIQPLQTSEVNSCDESSSASTISQSNLSDEGFFHLLQSIERMVLLREQGGMELYQRAGINQKQLLRLISVCNRMGALRVEDLEACCALVLCKTQELLKSTFVGYSHEATAGIHNTDESKERFLSRKCQERLLGHIAFLNKHHILNEKVLPECFTSVMMLSDGQNSCKSVENVENSTEDGNVPQVSSTMKDDPLTIKPRQIVQELYKTTGSSHQEFETQVHPGVVLQSANISVESNTQAEEENDEDEISDLSEIYIPGLTVEEGNATTKASKKQISETSFSSSEKSPISRKEDKNIQPNYMKSNNMSTGNKFSKVVTTVKSKAFWGESEDSSSEIEAMLRPKTESVDDFDDFFD
uniref:Centrosomal protein kizuna n=1 Tax=Xenopus laevis TaxID=8355 RepID=KIZ_XENLA|nr:RecName: Full=Centrosomal protein kizuna; AltName: Full=Polo-like kinase 1 substrate 1 [Xenopus laevis]